MNSAIESGADRALVERFLHTRDEASFRALYRAHTPALLLLARRLAGASAADAEDAVQEAWLRAVRRLEGFRWESGLRTWLASITVNCVREMQRRRRPEAVPDELPAPPASTAALDVESLLRALPEGLRQVLVLHDIEGYTHEEIAALLGIATGTSKSQLFRARRALRAWLNGTAGAGREK